MKILFKYLTLIILCLLINGCDDSSEQSSIRFAVSADYPPFSFVNNGKIIGFEIDLAKALAKKLNKKAIFKDIQFSSIPPIVSNGQVDLAIASITRTEQRALKFSFSDDYYFPIDGLSVISEHDGVSIRDIDDKGKIVVCQLGSIMELWIKDKIASRKIKAKLIAMDSTAQIIEAIKSKQADFAIIETRQAIEIVSKTSNLKYSIIDKNITKGYSMMLKKNSPLLNDVNKAIKDLKEDGTMEKLYSKWFNKNKR